MTDFEDEQDELNRVEQQQALIAVQAGRMERYCKPGKWRVFMKDGEAVLEVFGESE